MLSRASAQAMLARLKRLANEFSELHSDDALLPVGERRPASLIPGDASVGARRVPRAAPPKPPGRTQREK
jgi:hypothetical protein